MLAPEPSKPLSSMCFLHIFFRKASFDPNETMIMRRATALPFVAIPGILDLELRTHNLAHEKSESSMEMVGGDMRVITNVLSRNLDPLSGCAIPPLNIPGHVP